MKSFFKTGFSIVFVGVVSFFSITSAQGSKDLTASLAQIPGLVDSPEKGVFVDLVKAIDEVYTEGSIKIVVYPFARSIDNAISGKADFHIPTFRNPAIDPSKHPFRMVTEKMGDLAVVIYSNAEKPITKQMVDDALKQNGKFAYTIEGAGGMESNFYFPVVSSNDFALSLKKISTKRIDALVWPQEEVDAVIKAQNIPNIHREFLAYWDDAIIIAKGPNGDRIDKILSDALKKLKASGKMDPLYSKIHHPYSDWQPAH